MSGNRFRFKQFDVEQSRSAMKVGTDGVVLGAWVNLTGGERNILDVGTGTGVIALMLGQRTQAYGAKPKIDAVEVEVEAAREANGNFERAAWGERMGVKCVPIQRYTPEEKYDLIVSNPPYFMAGFDRNKAQQGIGLNRSPGVKPPSRERVAARHADLLPYEELIEAVVRLLEPERGRFGAIFPYGEFGVFVAKAAGQGLYCHRQMEIRGTEKKGVKRVAAEFSLNKPEEVVRETLCIEDEDGYSQKYRELTRDFYLKF